MSEFDSGMRLLADIGATNARFALEVAPGRYWAMDVLPCETFTSIEHAISSFLAQNGSPEVRHAGIAIANPILGDWIQMTNHHWAFSVEALRRHMKWQTLLVVNDFTAMAMSLPTLTPNEVIQIGPGQAEPGSVLGVLGAGTGLGVSGLVSLNGRQTALASEGGHVSYAAQDSDEALVVARAEAKFGHASAERLVSGPGLELMYEVLAKQAKHIPATRTAPQITQLAQTEEDAICARAVHMFCAMLGSVAGNLALTLGSRGGVYIAGAIVPRIEDMLRSSQFRSRFENKGRFKTWLKDVPTFVINTPRPAMRGLSAILADHLNEGAGSHRMLDEVKGALERLTPAERHVARDLLEAPQSWMVDPIGQIAARAKVSTPTVLRFCRSMGFKGLSDFKLRLGAGLGGATRLTHSDVHLSDPAADRYAKMINNTVSALLSVRDRLNPSILEGASQQVHRAQRVECFGLGLSATAALDAQNKLCHVGVCAVARTDLQLQLAAATHLTRSDLVLWFAHPDSDALQKTLLANVRSKGITIVAMAASGSDLYKQADFCLPVDHAKDRESPVPMFAQLAQTALLDLLVTSVALIRGVSPSNANSANIP